MLRINSSSDASKQLVLKFVLESIDYRKRSLYLQEIISMGRVNQVWLKALHTFFDTPFEKISLASFSKS